MGLPQTVRQPWFWAGVAIVVAALPLLGAAVAGAMSWGEIHPAINALLNGGSTLCLIGGFRAIRSRRRSLHARFMMTAFGLSALFLISYVARYCVSGTHVYPGREWDRSLYLAVLLSHTVLALTVVPLVVLALYQAWRQRFARHKRIARWLWPIWLYVSVTGVVVYLMLYQLAPRLHP